MLGIPFLDEAITKWFKPQTYDDGIDRLNYFVTATLLTFFALMVSAKQYVGAPIQCWMPMEFKASIFQPECSVVNKGGWEEYAEDYCFIQNTYYVAPDEEIPTEHAERDQRQFGYYQWVPVVLALQAFMFYLPNWIWKTLHQQSGIDLNTAISDARKLRSLNYEERHAEIQKLVTYVNECLEVTESRRTPRRFLCFRVGRNLGSYVSMLYLLIKLLYLVNVFGQFVLLNGFIGRGYNMWGVTALMSLWTGEGWTDSPVFPRVSLCDFRVRRLANMHRYTVQCVLMINMFNEKIYLFIWFWFLFVAVSTIINFFYCAFTLIPPMARERTITQFLKQEKLTEFADSKDGHDLIAEFTNQGLRPDGVLLLRFIEGHAGAIVAKDLCGQLFKTFLESCHPPYLASSRAPGSHSTKSTSPGIDEPYAHHKLHHPYDEKTSFIEQPDSGSSPPSYMGPPKPKHV